MPEGEKIGGEGGSSKGTFLSKDNDVFVISPKRQTFYFPELGNLNFGD